MSYETGWLLPPKPIRGLDHLGVQATSVALYTELLPGITNVTDRARYFTFHPWLLREFERRFTDRSGDAFVRLLRRSECLLTLVAIRHRSVTEEAAELHDQGAVGNRALGRAYAAIIEHGSVDLSTYAGPDGEDRYFKGEWGAFGQYYLGSLMDLHLVGYVKGSKQPGYGNVAGVEAADSFGQGVESDRFFEVVAGESVGMTDLDELASYCFCQIKTNPPEQRFLSRLFLAHASGADPYGEARRASLGLLLAIVDAGEASVLEHALRPAAYSQHLPAGTPWDPGSEGLNEAASLWGIYQRHELLSIAIQGLFWAVLQGMHQRRRGRLANVRDAGELLVELASESDWRGELSNPMREVLNLVAPELPMIGDWENELHEHQRGSEVSRLARSFTATPDGVLATVGHSVAVLVALLIRDPGVGYAGFDQPAERFGGTEIDLISFETEREKWMEMTMADWLRWLAINWVMRRHLRVAMRKLRADGRDTFRVRPVDDGLRLVEVAPAGFTGPRVAKAQQLLIDLGLIERIGDQGVLSLTSAGRAELAAIRG